MLSKQLQTIVLISPFQIWTSNIRKRTKLLKISFTTTILMFPIGTPEDWLIFHLITRKVRSNYVWCCCLRLLLYTSLLQFQIHLFMTWVKFLWSKDELMLKRLCQNYITKLLCYQVLINMVTWRCNDGLINISTLKT